MQRERKKKLFLLIIIFILNKTTFDGRTWDHSCTLILDFCYLGSVTHVWKYLNIFWQREILSHFQVYEVDSFLRTHYPTSTLNWLVSFFVLLVR